MQETIESLAYKWGFPFLRKQYAHDCFFFIEWVGVVQKKRNLYNT